MRKYFALLLALVLCLSAAGCKDNTPGETNPPETSGSASVPTDTEDTEPSGSEEATEPSAEPTGLRLGVLRDSAALGAAGLAGSGRYQVTSGSDAAGKLAAGELDAAIIPVSTASRLYNETGGKVKLAAITASGGWVLVERGDSVRDIFGLVGRTVYLPNGFDAAARIFEYIAEEYGYIVGDTLDVRYVDEGSLLDTDLALMPSFSAGIAIVRDSGFRIALDIQEQWTYLTGETMLPAGCLAVRSDLGDEELKALLADLEKSQKTVSDNLDAAVEAGMAENQEEAWAALEGCDLIWIQGESEMREALADYLSALYTMDPALIGGFVPDDGFYR